MPMIKYFPEFRQAYNYDCGANALQSILIYFGHDVREDKIMKMAGTNMKIGTPISGMKKVADFYHLKYREGKMTLASLKKELRAGNPVLLVLQAWANKKPVNWRNDWADGHYVVAIGYDKNRIYFEDPSATERTWQSFKELDDRWHDTDGKKENVFDHWGMVFSGRHKHYDPTKAIHMD